MRQAVNRTFSVRAGAGEKGAAARLIAQQITSFNHLSSVMRADLSAI